MANLECRFQNGYFSGIFTTTTLHWNSHIEFVFSFFKYKNTHSSPFNSILSWSEDTVVWMFVYSTKFFNFLRFLFITFWKKISKLFHKTCIASNIFKSGLRLQNIQKKIQGIDENYGFAENFFISRGIAHMRWIDFLYFYIYNFWPEVKRRHMKCQYIY